MISIIVSSHNPCYFKNLEQNILETIGVPYEIIQIWNPGIMSINEAYESGLSISKFENLLFIHEDIVFLNQNWGKFLLNLLSIENLGLVGLAGSNYLPVTPSDWYVSDRFNFMNVIEGKNENQVTLHNLERDLHKVIALDGVFLFGKKSIFNEVGFDKKLTGFHGYDLSISLRVAEKYQNYVVNNINIQHFSGGNKTLDWFNSTLYVRESFNHSFSHMKDYLIENIVFRKFVKNAIKYRGKSYETVKLILKYYPHKFINSPLDHLRLTFFIIKSFLSK